MVHIVGAGPVGNYTAYRLACAGFDPVVHEEHSTIGKPVQCTGILTSYLSDMLSLGVKPDDFIVNTISGTRVFGPNKEHVYVKLKKNYIVDRQRFDSYIAELALSEGARYELNSRFVAGKKEGHNFKLQFADGSIVRDSTVVGADGPSSLVAREFGLFGERKFVVGVQARVKMKNKIDADTVDFYVDKAVPGYIGWVVPEDENIARIGVASYDGAKQHFQELVKKQQGEILEWQSGVIPLYDNKLPTQDDGLYLIGDAATMVKATTYGGIIPSMHVAQALQQSLETGKSYEKLWKKSIGRNLWLHLKMRRMMDKFSEEQYNNLISYACNEGVTGLLEQYDREYPTKLLLSMLLKEPRFLRFLPYGF